MVYFVWALSVVFHIIKMMEDKRICRLCLKIICDNDFDPTEEVTIYMLDMLLVKPKLGEYIEYVVCTVCSKSLKEAFGFKMACLKIETKILAFADSKENVKIDLKLLYLKEEPNVEASEIAENQKICRFCLNLTAIDCCTYLNESKKYIFIVDTLQNHIPELNLSITEELVSCETCLDSLQNFHKFVNICLGSIKESLNKKLDDENQIKDEILCSSVIKKEESVTIETEIKSQDAMKIEYVDVDIKNDDNSDIIDQACNSFLTLKPEDLSRHTFVNKDPAEITIYKCNICPYEAKRKRLLTRHMVNHKHPSEIKLYKCDRCSYETRHKRCLLNHELGHKSPLETPVIKCGLCIYETRIKRNLSRHMLSHKSNSELPMYKCDQCPYESMRRDRLMTHKLNHKDPSDIPVYRCEICTYESKYKSALSKHSKIHKIPENIMYKCDVCTYETWNKRNLMAHNLLHRDPSKINWFNCELCTYKTKYRGHLKIHCGRKHKDPSKVKMYKCAACPYQTKLKVDLNKHAIIHKQPPEITMYKCEVCSFITKYKEHHMLIHKGHAT